jgi:hypothetical protein
MGSGGGEGVASASGSQENGGLRSDGLSLSVIGRVLFIYLFILASRRIRVALGQFMM